MRNIGDPDRVIGSKIMTKLDDISESFEVKLESLKPKQDASIYDESRVFELTTNAPDATITDSSMITTGPIIEFPTIGVWSHYWADRIRQVPQKITFPSGKILSSLWRSWRIPDFVLKVCPWKFLRTEDIEHTPRGKTKYNEMKIVVGELLHEVSKSKEFSDKYEKGNKNLLVLETFFEKVKFIYQNTNLRALSLNLMSWESLVKIERNMKHDRERPDSPKQYSTPYVHETPKKERDRPRKGTTTTRTTKKKTITTTKKSTTTTTTTRKNNSRSKNQSRRQVSLAPRTNRKKQGHRIKKQAPEMYFLIQ